MALSVLVVGTGRLAQALIHRLSSCEDISLSVAGRTEERKAFLSGRYGIPAYSVDYCLEANPDVILLAVRDDVVDPLASSLPKGNTVVLHHAGSLPLNAIGRHHAHAGVLYPLQTFALPESVRWDEIPLLVQFTSDKAAEALTFLSDRLGGPVRFTTDQERERLHLAAVWVNNFSRLMLAEAQALCNVWKIPFELLHPLISHTFSPHSLEHNQKELLTGPAVRGDEATIARHLALLKDYPEAAELYEFLTQRLRSVGKI